jgi:hypothetical protein
MDTAHCNNAGSVLTKYSVKPRFHPTFLSTGARASWQPTHYSSLSHIPRFPFGVRAFLGLRSRRVLLLFKFHAALHLVNSNTAHLDPSPLAPRFTHLRPTVLSHTRSAQHTRQSPGNLIQYRQDDENLVHGTSLNSSAPARGFQASERLIGAIEETAAAR